MSLKRYFILAGIFIIASGCSSIKRSILNVSDKYQYHPGFYLYDPVAKKELLSINADKYFTPASNTKAFTFFSALSVLPDSIPAFRYIKTDSSLQIWGLADPGFLNPKLPQGTSYAFLSQSPKVSVSDANYYSKRLGPGWAWDDYADDYSQEKSYLPIYGNSVVFDIDSISRELKVDPKIFRDSVLIRPGEEYRVWRPEFNNRFEWDTTACEDCERLRPIHFSGNTLQNLLKDTLKITVEMNHLPLPDSAKTYYSIPKDSVLKIMMQESDNFMAEHLLMSCAAQLTDSVSSQVGIKYMSEKINAFVPDPLVWRDGSGLSRYNLFTPRSMVYLWDRLYKDIGEERLFSLISVGGERGTLKEWFKADKPYIYGKTGTLSNNFNLSGFLITKSGKRLIFSYMNNNYPVHASTIRKEMETVLREVYEKY